MCVKSIRRLHFHFKEIELFFFFQIIVLSFENQFQLFSRGFKFNFILLIQIRNICTEWNFNIKYLLCIVKMFTTHLFAFQVFLAALRRLSSLLWFQSAFAYHTKNINEAHCVNKNANSNSFMVMSLNEFLLTVKIEYYYVNMFGRRHYFRTKRQRVFFNKFS